jgi:Flp pilus assembly protein TadD
MGDCTRPLRLREGRFPLMPTFPQRVLSWTCTAILIASMPVWHMVAQTTTTPTLFNVRGMVLCDAATSIPENLGVDLASLAGPIQHTFLRSDHSFEFQGLTEGHYVIQIRNEKFDDVDQSIDLSRQRSLPGASATFVIVVVLTPKGMHDPKKQALDADDEFGNTIAVTALSTKIPKNAMKLYRKSLQARQKKFYIQEIADLKEALLVFPTFYSAQRNLGIAYYHSRQTTLALAPLQAALNLNPQSGKVNFFLGLCSLDMQDLDGSRKFLEQSSRLAPDKALPLYILGYVDYKLNRLDNAKKALKQAMILDPEFASYSRLQLANVYLKESQLTEAYGEMEDFLKEKPQADEIAQVMHNLRVLRQVLETTPR